MDNFPVLEPDDRPLIHKAYKALLSAFKEPLNDEDRKNIRAAFEMAARAHVQQRRKMGGPYIIHPIEVARICISEIGLGPTAAVCALLHDTVEDTEVTVEDVRNQFGSKVAEIVDGLTKLDGLHESHSSKQAENITKVLQAMVKDVRVVLIKIADRLHNMRTIKGMPHQKQLKIAAETTTVYAPLAHRLGLYSIKSEFQDICLKITHPEEYSFIAKKLAETKASREQYIQNFISILEKRFKESDFQFAAKIVGRPKSIHSIWAKIRAQDIPIEKMYDLMGVRIILQNVPPDKEKKYCWHVYAEVADAFNPVPDRLKDWINKPKPNGYESLHTTVVGPQGRFVEVQIRTQRMDEIAERGFAAHWKYKGVRSMQSGIPDSFEQWLNQVKDILENPALNESKVELLAEFRSSLHTEEIYVFTPKGEMRTLPKGATVLDFAFSIHTDVGLTCRAAHINSGEGEYLAPIFHRLQSGDQVRIVTDEKVKPTEEWLQNVKSSRARTRIRAALNEEKGRLAKEGREMLRRKFKNLKVTNYDDSILALLKWYGYPNHIEFLCAVYLKQISLAALRKFFTVENGRLVPQNKEDAKTSAKPAPAPDPKPGPSRPYASKTPQIIINNEPGSHYVYTFANCCNPVFGDPIFAYITSNHAVKIHRMTCSNAENLYATYDYRILPAEWGNLAQTEFEVTLRIQGIDIGKGVIARITETITNIGLNIKSFSISGEGGYFTGVVGLYINRVDQVQEIIRTLKNFEWINNVQRISNDKE